MRLRSVLEQGTHRLVLRRRLPVPFSNARIYVTTEGGLRYLRRDMSSVDPVLLRLAADVVRPGHTVWDIGANVGLFTFAAAAAAGPGGHVLAIEPDTDLVSLLRRSVRCNRALATVQVLPAAVSAEVSAAQFNVARRNKATSYLDGFGTTMAGGARSTQLVPTVTLDWLAERFAAPDVVKIDVEGAEAEVLAGGATLLGSIPTIICEVAARNAATVSALLSAHGYALYDGDRPRVGREQVAVAPPNTLAMVRSATV